VQVGELYQEYLSQSASKVGGSECSSRDDDWVDHADYFEVYLPPDDPHVRGDFGND